MASRLPPLHALRAFEAFARLRSVTGASEDLCVTHSAIIHQLRQLQDWMGIELFRRGPHGLMLTEAAERYRMTVCDAFQRISSETRLLRAGTQNKAVRLSVLPMFGIAWLMPRLPDFWAHHPDVEVTIDYTPPAEDQFAGQDLAVRLQNPSKLPPSLTLRLFDGVTVPVCSPAYLQRFGKISRPKDLVTRTLIHDEDKTGWTEWFAKAGLPASAASSGVVFADGNLTLASVLAGEGVGLLRRSLLREQFRAKTLVQLFDLIGDEQLAYVLRWHADRPLNRDIEIFRDWLAVKSNEHGNAGQNGQHL